MPLLVDDLKDNKLYRKKIFLPSDPKNKRKHSAIFLMTPNYTSSVKAMNNPFFLNNGRYESYYTEKDITFVLSEDHRLLENSDDICITEVSIPQCTRITCTTTQELDKYGIPHSDDLVAFTAHVFVDYNNIVCGYFIMTEYNTRLYDVSAISYKMKRDLIEFAILLYNPKTVKVRTDADRKLYSKYNFKSVKYTDDKLNIMVHENGALTESLATTKIDIEIALWTSQIKVTEMIIKNFGDDNWMSHMYKEVKRKLVKIPLKGYAESADDTIDRWKAKLQDQKATLDFYLAIKEIDAKEMFDISDIMQEYVDWVDSLSCPKALKLKIINEVIDSYKKSIKEYEYNLKRYRALNDAQKRVENVAALASKVFSIFSWVNATPIGIIRGKLVSAILPKSQKKAVLSEAELEAKIELYTKIVETLEEKKKEVEALDEEAFIGLVNEISMMYDIPFTIVTETKKYKKTAGESKDLAKARQFVTDVKHLANEYKLPVFVITNGASGYSNNGCEAVKHARDSHIEWEKKHRADPYEDWSDRLYNESVLLESPIPPKSADKKGAYCAFPSEKWDGKSMDEDCTDITIEHAINNFLQTKYPDHEDKSTCCIFVLDINNILHFIGQARIESTDPIKYSWIRKVRTPSKFIMYESSLLESKSVDDTIKNIDGYISHKQMRDNIYLVRRKRHYNDDGKDHTENWLYILTDDNKIAAEMLLYNKNTEMYSLETKKKYRNHGYATQLIICAVNDLGANFLSIKSSDENGPAHKLYLKLGFKEYDRNKNYIYLRINGRVNESTLLENALLEDKLSSRNRKDLPDSAFGLPEERRYPMPDKSHILSAIRMFNHVEADNEKKLAYNIKNKIKEFGMEDEVNVSSDNRFSKYYSARVHEDYIVPYIEEEAVLTAFGLQTETTITFLEGNDDVLVEADTAYNAALRRILYSERIKNHKEVMLLYDQVKQDCPFIKYTFVNYDRYTGRNLFIDWSYYTKAFFKNNVRKYDKAVDLYFEFVNRFLDDKRLDSLGYDKKTIFIPVDDWIPEKDKEYWNYKEHLNPISIIYRLVFRDLEKLKSSWGDRTFIFTGRNGYFKMNFSNFQKKDLPRFLQNIKILVGNFPISDDTDEPDNSTAGIVNMVIDKIEANSDIRINNLTGATKASEEEIKDRIDNAAASSEDKSPEEKLVDAIATTAKTSKDDDEVIQKMDNDEYIKQLVIDLRNSSADNVSIEPTRAARMRKLNDQFAKKSINGKTISQILTDTNDKPLPEIAIPIDSINDDWKHMKFVNHSKEYDLSADIIRCINHFADTTVPVSVIDLSVEDTSTSEDWVETWTVRCEDSYGKRFTLKFDIPKLKNDRSMKLRGNDKTINGQLMNLPIIKTEQNTCQMTSNYNKIFFSGYGKSTGKSYVVADRIIKTLNKMGPNSDIKVDFGDNSRICAKYELPMDYIDIASVISKITYFNRHIKVKYTLFFNQDELYEKYGKLITDKDALPIGIMESDSFKGANILYAKADVPVSFLIHEILFPNEKFAEVYSTTNTSVRYTYSKASILNTDIPVAVIIGYYIGLIPMLDRAGVKYEVSDKRPKYDKNVQDIIRLSDAYILYNLDYDSSMLLNGLKECDLAAYSLKEVNSKKMWVEFLDNFGGRLKADGLDMFYDLMLDPITKIVCDKYDLPTDFIDALLYANMLMSDNKYNRHVDITGNRYRTTEIIAGYTYKALCNSYTQYRRDIRAGRDAKMTIKQSAVIDLLFVDNTFGDLSSLSDLLEYESLSSTSFKGLSGMNSDRAYGLDKRTFDESMVNVLALSTGFAANAGINRQTTIDMNIDSTRGYIKNNNPSDMSVTKTFCMTEALTPFGATSDDPFRSAMTFIQTSKHEMRTKISDPLLVTNGADEALPYLTSNTFTYKTKDPGKVKELTDEYMVIEYKNGSTEVIDLRERILKNSDGGMYITLKLDTDLKEGNVFSGNEIIAYDKTSYTAGVGPSKGFAYDIGTFVKFAVINSDEGFEDSCIETEWIADAMSSTVVINKEYTLPKDTNVYFIAKKGQPIQEGEPLLIFQNAFDEEDANMLIKALSADEDDDIVAELGRIPIYSKVTGVVKDIKILRTVETDELSPSLKKIVTDYEKEVKKFNKVLEKYDPEKAKVADATYKLEPTGKLKNAANSVRIEFSLAYEDKFSVGDKTVCYSALKGVSKGKIPKGLEPYSQYRPDEKIHYIQSTTGDMKRMVGSILKIGAINKVMVELARQSCDIMGIRWKYFDEY